MRERGASPMLEKKGVSSMKIANPYLAAFQRHRYDEPHPNTLDRHACVARRYAWAVPTSEAVVLLAQHGPLVELGAGTGYWAWIVRQCGVDIVAYDIAAIAKTWVEVVTGDETCLDQYPGRTLLLCWPPTDSPLAGQALTWTADSTEGIAPLLLKG